MKYLMLIKHSEHDRGEPIPQALMDAMGKFVEEGLKSGVLKDTAGLKATSEGFRVRSRDGKLHVTDDTTGTTFSVMLVPHTLGRTTLATLKAGTQVNIEIDVLARYVERRLAMTSTDESKDAKDESSLLEKLRNGSYI